MQTNPIDTTPIDWSRLSQELLQVANQARVEQQQPTKDLSEEELRERLRECINISNQRKRTPVSDELQHQRMAALALLPPEERNNFLQVMSQLKEQQQAEFNRRTQAVRSTLETKCFGTDPRARRLRQGAKLMLKASIECVPKTTSFTTCEEIQKELIFILNAAEHFGILPSEVNHTKKDEYKEFCANQAAQELLEMFKDKKKTNKKRKPRVIKQIQAEKSEKQSSNLRESKTSKDSSRKNEEEIVNTSIPTKTETISEHFRVTSRWRSKNLDELRQLVDKVNGELVTRYLHLKDEDLLLQRAYHYLPGIEKLLIDPISRRKYTFKTERGFGMIAKLFNQAVSYDGIIYFGVDTRETDKNIQHIVYHKYFTTIDNLNQIFSDSTERLQEESDDNPEEWHSVGTSSITQQKNGLLDVRFKKETHRLSIYPIRN